MTRIITALFDSRDDADAGAERLRQAGVDAGNVNVHDQSSHELGNDASTPKKTGLWASIKHAVLPDEDRHTYEEGLRRGGFLLTAEIEDDKAPEAVRALEEASSVDLDARTEQWRSDGWDYAPTSGVDDDIAYGVRDTDRTDDRFRSYTVSDRDRG